jgi:hypothetical protein
MRESVRGFVLSGVLVGAVAALAMHGTAEAAPIYFNRQWHLSTLVPVPAGANSQLVSSLLTTVTSTLNNPVTGTPYEFTITDVTYDFTELALQAPDNAGHRVKFQVALVENGSIYQNSSVIAAGGLFNTTAQSGVIANTCAPRGQNFPAVPGILLHSAGYWMSRDVVYDGALAGLNGTPITSDGGTVMGFDEGCRSLEIHQEGLTTFSENFTTGLLLPHGTTLSAVQRYATNNPIGMLDTAMFPGTIPYTWIHLQGQVR